MCMAPLNRPLARDSSKRYPQAAVGRRTMWPGRRLGREPGRIFAGEEKESPVPQDSDGPLNAPAYDDGST